MASTIALPSRLPFRSVSHGPTNFHFDHEQVNIITDQETEYDADVETLDSDEEQPQCEVIKSITTTTQAPASPIISWQSFNTTQSGTTRVEIAQVDIASQAVLLENGNWRAIRTPQTQSVQINPPRHSGWTPIDVPSTNTSQMSIIKVEASDTEETQSSFVRDNVWSVTSGSQTDTSPATSVEHDEPSSSYPQTSHTLHVRPTKIRPAKKIVSESDMPKLKIQFRRYKKEFSSESAIAQIEWFSHRIEYLRMGNKDEYKFKLAALRSEWDSIWERRRWLKQEMLRIKNLYTMARRERQKRIQHNLRASYDVAFHKIIAGN